MAFYAAVFRLTILKINVPTLIHSLLQFVYYQIYLSRFSCCCDNNHCLMTRKKIGNFLYISFVAQPHSQHAILFVVFYWLTLMKILCPSKVGEGGGGWSHVLVQIIPQPIYQQSTTNDFYYCRLFEICTAIQLTLSNFIKQAMELQTLCRLNRIPIGKWNKLLFHRSQWMSRSFFFLIERVFVCVCGFFFGANSSYHSIERVISFLHSFHYYWINLLAVPIWKAKRTRYHTIPHHTAYRQSVWALVY